MRAELAGMIVRKDDKRKIVYGPVLVPGEPDSDGDVVTAEKIEAVAHEWLAKYQNNDLQHSLINVGVPVESFISPVDLEFEVPGGQARVSIPAGTWMLGVKVEDQATWAKVQSGELTGFSIMAVSAAALKSSASAADVQAALKRVTLADLGPDWKVVAVSLVDDPAVPKAKWLAVKGKSAVPPEPEGFWERLTRALGRQPGEKAGRTISDQTLAQLTRIRDAHKQSLVTIEELIRLAEEERGGKSAGTHINKQEGIDMNPEELKALMTQAVSEGTKPLTDAISQLVTVLQGNAAAGTQDPEAGKSKPEEKPADHPAGKSDPAQQPADEMAALKAKVDQLEAAAARPRSLKGQDTEDAPAAKAPTSDRDAFGRKRKNSA